MKLIKMTKQLHEQIQRSDAIFLPDGQHYGKFANFGFLVDNGCVSDVLACFGVWMGIEDLVRKYEVLPLEKWFQMEQNSNLIDSLRRYSRTNQISLSEMVETTGKIIVVDSSIVAYEPEFDEEMIITA